LSFFASDYFLGVGQCGCVASDYFLGVGQCGCVASDYFLGVGQCGCVASDYFLRFGQGRCDASDFSKKKDCSDAKKTGKTYYSNIINHAYGILKLKQL